MYFYDNGDVASEEGHRFENLVANTLLKRLHFIEDYTGYKARLHYLRDKDGREVDFVTIINNQVYELIEVKLSSTTISSHLNYYREKLKPRHCVQIVANLDRCYHEKGVFVTNPIEYFKSPPWEGAEELRF